MSYADTIRCLTCLNYAAKCLRQGNTSCESTDPVTYVLEQRNKLLAFGYLLCINWNGAANYESVELAAYSFFSWYRIASLATNHARSLR
jgi:hypothetical protein